jgi:hypothetical protein
MNKEALKRIFDFIKNKDNKRHKKDGTLEWKLLFNEPLTEEDLNVKGNLDLSFSKIESLPKGLKVGGDLDLVKSESLTFLPEGLEVGNHLYLSFSKIESLPKGLKVGGNLNLFKCVKLTSLPKGLKVGGDLHIYGAPIAKFEDNEIREMIKPGFIKGNIY